MRVGQILLCASILLVAAAVPSAAQEAWKMDCNHPSWGENLRAHWEQFRDTVEMHRKRVLYWPEPFQQQDRELVRGPFRTMADNGWKLQNTLPDELFDKESQELTYAGRLKLRWLLTQMPPHRRQVYVLEGDTAAATDARVASVQRHLNEIAPDQAHGVWTTRIVPPSGEGTYIYGVSQKLHTAAPTPRLPARSTGAGDAGSGASGSQSGSSNP